MASSLSLAALEILVNLDLPADQLPSDLVAMKLALPDDLSLGEIHRPQLPDDWTGRGGWPACQAIGNEWLDERGSAALWVPSAVVPLERNLLLNPAHPESAQIPAPDLSPFGFDERLLALLDAKFGRANQH